MDTQIDELMLQQQKIYISFLEIFQHETTRIHIECRVHSLEKIWTLTSPTAIADIFVNPNTGDSTSFLYVMYIRHSRLFEKARMGRMKISRSRGDGSLS